MHESINILALTALIIGLTHTAMGPDHYLPFIVLGRSEGWSLKKTWAWTFICGLGHVGSSVVIGSIGIALGWSLAGMNGFESIRGEVAAYSLIGFGAIYMLWGILKVKKGKVGHHTHIHKHVHADGTIHSHSHAHLSMFSHSHKHSGKNNKTDGKEQKSHNKTAKTLFIIFVLGPCEPLIPMLLVPASARSTWGIALVSGVFAAATIFAMLTIVTAGYLGFKIIKFDFLEKYIHAFSGGAILASGLMIQLFGF